MRVVIACVLMAGMGVSGAQIAGANPPAPTPNDVDFWCQQGVKLEPVSTPFVVPPPPGGFTWTLLVLKAGSDESVPQAPGPNETFSNPVVGQAYVHHSGKDISHVILCKVPSTTTTTAPTTTAPSTTIATTTTAATTLATTTTAPTTTIATTTTGVTTTTQATTTTVPVTTTNPGICCLQDTTTTTVAQTTTTAPTTTVPPTVAVRAAEPPPEVAEPTTVAPVPAPTELPVTGAGSPWWLALFGACMVALGFLFLAWRRTDA